MVLLYSLGHGMGTSRCRRYDTVGDVGLVLADVGGSALL